MELSDKTRGNVRVILTDLSETISKEEKGIKALALAKANRELIQNEIHIKVEKDRIARTEVLSQADIAVGFIYRDVECLIRWHHPEPYVKTLVRIDTAEVITEPMTTQEINLFTEAEKKREEERKAAEEAAQEGGDNGKE